MSKITLQKDLYPEGTISFKLTPIENGKDRLFLIDIGTGGEENRITLVISKNTDGTRDLLLELCNNEGECLNESRLFQDFQLGLAFNVELVWSTNKKKIAVFLDNESFLEIEDEKIKFNNLGNTIHYGEDINGENQTEMTAE